MSSGIPRLERVFPGVEEDVGHVKIWKGLLGNVGFFPDPVQLETGFDFELNLCSLFYTLIAICATSVSKCSEFLGKIIFQASFPFIQTHGEV